MQKRAAIDYKAAGVDIDKKASFVEDIYAPMRKTFGPRVVENPNGFAGLFALNHKSPPGSGVKEYKDPVIVSSTDGVGTKLKIAFMMEKHDTIGIDLVAMCVNDVITLGAEPLFFLDYLASSKIMPEKARKVVAGIVDGCREAGCALLGGETPELPGFYNDGEYDLAGFAVGVVEKKRIINGSTIKPDDVVIGLLSSGLHSNGYSLVRKILFDTVKLPIDCHLDGLDTTLGEELLKPTKIYVNAVNAVANKSRTRNVLKGIAHITGGGLIENIPRVLPEGCSVSLKGGSWPVPNIFSIIRKSGNLPSGEMYRVFNMGIGMALIVSPVYANSVLKTLKQAGEDAVEIGRVTAGDKEVTIDWTT